MAQEANRHLSALTIPRRINYVNIRLKVKNSQQEKHLESEIIIRLRKFSIFNCGNYVKSESA